MHRTSNPNANILSQVTVLQGLVDNAILYIYRTGTEQRYQKRISVLLGWYLVGAEQHRKPAVQQSRLPVPPLLFALIVSGIIQVFVFVFVTPSILQCVPGSMYRVQELHVKNKLHVSWFTGSLQKHSRRECSAAGKMMYFHWLKLFPKNGTEKKMIDSEK